MTRGEFWGRKMGLASSLGGSTFADTSEAALAEAVSCKTNNEGFGILYFADGSFVRVNAKGPLKPGWCDWGMGDGGSGEDFSA